MARLPLELQTPQHVLLWDRVVFALHHVSDAQQVPSSHGQLERACTTFWQRWTSEDREAMEGQWRPVYDSLGSAQGVFLRHPVQVLMPNLVE